ncbi:hypothetical protein CIPAW_15G169100 [Carya illinoinensis]|uniref:Uncharacterized protein n=1 Tax=Carya illinoinensis TaxID=32201 RepID=A0A8T1NDV2_CARIL|nr:hypothetical protein CIPAW_15G169100 [Carya illinoinensis]
MAVSVEWNWQVLTNMMKLELFLPTTAQVLASIGRRIRFLQYHRFNSSSPTRFPIDKGSSSTIVPTRTNVLRDSILHSISGRSRRLEQFPRLSSRKDLNLRLLEKIQSLEHPSKLRLESHGRQIL